MSGRRVDGEERVVADIPFMERCPEGQHLPGLELDSAQRALTDFSSLVLAAPVGDSPGVTGGQVELEFAGPVSLMVRPGVIIGGCSETPLVFAASAGGSPEVVGCGAIRAHTDRAMTGSEAHDGTELLSREPVKLLNQAEVEEDKEFDREILSLVRSLGGDSAQYRRERSCAVRAVVSEIYSLPRVSAVAKLCPSYAILPGFALDLATNDSDGRHWDFVEEAMRSHAWAKVKEEQPVLLI